MLPKRSLKAIGSDNITSFDIYRDKLLVSYSSGNITFSKFSPSLPGELIYLDRINISPCPVVKALFFGSETSIIYYQLDGKLFFMKLVSSPKSKGLTIQSKTEISKRNPIRNFFSCSNLLLIHYSSKFCLYQASHESISGKTAPVLNKILEKKCSSHRKIYFIMLPTKLILFDDKGMLKIYSITVNKAHNVHVKPLFEHSDLGIIQVFKKDKSCYCLNSAGVLKLCFPFEDQVTFETINKFSIMLNNKENSLLKSEKARNKSINLFDDKVVFIDPIINYLSYYDLLCRKQSAFPFNILFPITSVSKINGMKEFLVCANNKEVFIILPEVASSKAVGLVEAMDVNGFFNLINTQQIDDDKLYDVCFKLYVKCKKQNKIKWATDIILFLRKNKLLDKHTNQIDIFDFCEFLNKQFDLVENNFNILLELRNAGRSMLELILNEKDKIKSCSPGWSKVIDGTIASLVALQWSLFSNKNKEKQSDEEVSLAISNKIGLSKMLLHNNSYDLNILEKINKYGILEKDELREYQLSVYIGRNNKEEVQSLFPFNIEHKEDILIPRNKFKTLICIDYLLNTGETASRDQCFPLLKEAMVSKFITKEEFIYLIYTAITSESIDNIYSFMETFISVNDRIEIIQTRLFDQGIKYPDLSSYNIPKEKIIGPNTETNTVLSNKLTTYLLFDLAEKVSTVDDTIKINNCLASVYCLPGGRRVSILKDNDMVKFIRLYTEVANKKEFVEKLNTKITLSKNQIIKIVCTNLLDFKKALEMTIESKLWKMLEFCVFNNLKELSDKKVINPLEKLTSIKYNTNSRSSGSLDDNIETKKVIKIFIRTILKSESYYNDKKCNDVCSSILLNPRITSNYDISDVLDFSKTDKSFNYIKKLTLEKIKNMVIKESKLNLQNQIKTHILEDFSNIYNDNEENKMIEISDVPHCYICSKSINEKAYHTNIEHRHYYHVKCSKFV